jgi:hypothetical protein
MHPSKYRPALNAYCALLEEAKHRLVALDLLLSGKTGLAAGAVHESAYLQLRMLCETIALGCVIAKGDHEPTGKIRTEYRAGKIAEGRSARSLSLLVAATSLRVRNTSSLSLAVHRDGGTQVARWA